MARIAGFSCRLFHSWKKAVITVFLSGIFALPVCGQQIPLLSHYYSNPYLINPSAAGQHNATRASFIYRQQWVGIPGSPQTQAFIIDGPLQEESPVGLGLSVFNDQSDIVKRLSAMISGSYKVELATDHQLNFGLSFGIIRNTIDFDKVRADISDPGILRNAENRTTVDGNAGLTYHHKKFRAGFASEQLFNRRFSYQNDTDFREISYVLVRHYLVSFQYDLSLNENLTLSPLAILRTAQGLPAQFDFNATLKYQDLVWGNVAYRHDTGVGIALGVNVSNRFLVGYNYELPTSDLRHTTTGSHEVMIGLRFAKRTAVAAPQKAVNKKVMEEYKRDSDAQYEKLDELQQKNEVLNQQLSDYKQLIEQQHSEIEKLKQRVSSSDQELKTLIEQVKVDLQREKHFDKAYSYYLVIGAVRTFEDAKAFQKVILRETNIEPGIIQNDTQTWYFIYSDELLSAHEARKKLREIEKSAMKELIVGNPWVYKTIKR